MLSPVVPAKMAGRVAIKLTRQVLAADPPHLHPKILPMTSRPNQPTMASIFKSGAMSAAATTTREDSP
jgi:hypothetical protein